MFDGERTRKLFFFLLIASLLFESGVAYEHYRQGRQPGTVQFVEGAAGGSGPKDGAGGESAGSSSAPETPRFAYVHVVGAVKNPGLYRLKLPARVNDGVSQAIPEKDADLSLINLAEPIIDGQQIYVPHRGENQTLKANGSRKLAAVSRTIAGKININKATAGELDTGLPGVGPTLAGRIVEYRKTHGPFLSEAELRNVSGIGEKRFQELKDKITVR